MNSGLEKNIWSKSKARKLLGLFLIIIGLGYTYHSHLTGCPRYIIFGGWAIGPPIWFILEYWFLFDTEKEDLHSFKYYQTLCRNLWIGFLVYLAAFYLGNWK
ncbi:MAG: hypothetical protein CMH74_08790 [Nitrospina sp.]|nr:hypothetical protein [Nitrospina sp.]